MKLTRPSSNYQIKITEYKYIEVFVVVEDYTKTEDIVLFFIPCNE